MRRTTWKKSTFHSATLIKTAKEPGGKQLVLSLSKDQLEPYFNFGGRKFFNHMGRPRAILILIMVIIVTTVGYFTFVKKSEPVIQNQVTNTVTQTTALTTSSTNNTKASEPEPKRIANIRGYFFKKPTYGEDNPEVPMVCDTLVVTEVTGGEKSLIDEFIEWVEGGNTVDALDEKTGNLILNLDLDNLLQTEIQKIISSTAQNTVELQVIDTRTGYGKEATACHSFVNILKVD